MMTLTEPTIIALLLVANVVLLGAAALAILRFQLYFRRIEAFWNSPTGAALARDESAAVAPKPARDPGLERRVAELQSVVKTLARKSTQVAAPSKASLPLEKAVRMAKRGASVDQLMSTCGLNVGEARLMHKLHSARRETQHAN